MKGMGTLKGGRMSLWSAGTEELGIQRTREKELEDRRQRLESQMLETCIYGRAAVTGDDTVREWPCGPGGARHQ